MREELARRALQGAFKTLRGGFLGMIAMALPEETPQLHARLGAKMEQYFADDVVPTMIAALVADPRWTEDELLVLATFIESDVGNRWMAMGPEMQEAIGTEMRAVEGALYHQAKAELGEA